MNKSQSNAQQTTAVDDVRQVRRAIANEHQGNLRQHMQETNRIFRQLQKKLNLKLIPPPIPTGKTRPAG